MRGGLRWLKPGSGSAAAAVCAFACLWALFELPALAVDEAYRPSADPLALATAWLLAARAPGRALLRPLVGLAFGLLLLHRIDRAGFLLFMGQEPLAYDQLFLLRHLLVLLMDMWSLGLALIVLAMVASLVAIGWLLRALLRSFALPPAQPARKRVLAAGAVLWLLAIAGSLPIGSSRAVRWEAPHLAANLRESVRIYRMVHQRIGASPYREYAQIKLTRKPDIYLFMVESYGRVLLDQPYLRERYLPDIDRMARTVASAGWYSASGFSAAPVKGGRSWLAEATLLMGMRISYEAELRHVDSALDRVPHLPGFLAAQGYRTVLLAPADRVRPGLIDENRYGYRERVQFDRLQYRGKRYGWGLIPDQYSLEFTQEHVLGPGTRPLFFNFHMVSSHAPWKQIPRLADDWRSLSKPDKPLKKLADNASPFRPLKYFKRDNELDHMGELRDEMARRYRKAIAYDLELIADFLQRLQGDALVLVIGDHQPPFVAKGNASFDTPIHVLSRDPTLLFELMRHGFRPGLRLSADDPTALLHEGFLSLIVRTLAACCGSSPTLPEFRREGTATRGRS